MSNTPKTIQEALSNAEEAGVDVLAGELPAVTVRHRSTDTAGRRRFLSGSLALGATAMLGSTAALSADCDQNREQVQRCSDGDTGESADPTNCGRCGQESTVPSSNRHDASSRRLFGKRPEVLPGSNAPGVKRISD